MNIDESIGLKLKDQRNRKGYSTREVGRRLGVSNSYISRIEHGRIPSLKVLQQLCDLYGIELSSLFGKDVTPKQLSDVGVEWITFAEDMQKEQLTPDEIKELIEVVQKLRGK